MHCSFGESGTIQKHQPSSTGPTPVQHWSNIGPIRPTGVVPNGLAWAFVGRVGPMLDQCWTIMVPNGLAGDLLDVWDKCWTYVGPEWCLLAWQGTCWTCWTNVGPMLDRFGVNCLATGFVGRVGLMLDQCWTGLA